MCVEPSLTVAVHLNPLTPQPTGVHVAMVAEPKSQTIYSFVLSLLLFDLFLRVYVKADKYEIQMRLRDDWELHEALRTVGEWVAVEFGNVDSLDDNQLRYEYIYPSQAVHISWT